MCDEYNGWVNRETWCAGLWIGNEEAWYRLVVDTAHEVVSGALRPKYIPTENKRAWYVHELAEWLENYFGPQEVFDWDNVRFNENLYSVLMDIGSLYRVDWHEIAAHYIDGEMEEVSDR